MIKWVNFKKSIPNNYTMFYNRDIKKLVEKIYRNDIKNLGLYLGYVCYLRM